MSVLPKFPPCSLPHLLFSSLMSFCCSSLSSLHPNSYLSLVPVFLPSSHSSHFFVSLVLSFFVSFSHPVLSLRPLWFLILAHVFQVFPTATYLTSINSVINYLLQNLSECFCNNATILIGRAVAPMSLRRLENYEMFTKKHKRLKLTTNLLYFQTRQGTGIWFIPSLGC